MGINKDLLLGDFIALRPELVRATGGVTEAAIIALVDYRTKPEFRGSVEVDGVRWWPATIVDIADAVGISHKQVRPPLARLMEQGFLAVSAPDGKRRARHFRVAYADDLDCYSALPKWAKQSAQMGKSKCPNGQIKVPKWANQSAHLGKATSLLRKEEVLTLESNDIEQASKAKKFDEFYSVYPRRVGKKKALEKWLKAIKDGVDPEVIILAAKRLATDPNLPEKQFIPHPATWLHQARWEDEQLPVRKVTGGNVVSAINLVEMFKQREVNNVDVANRRAISQSYRN